MLSIPKWVLGDRQIYRGAREGAVGVYLRQLLRGRSGGARLEPAGRGPVPRQSCRRGSASSGGEAGTVPPAGVLGEAGARGFGRPGVPQTERRILRSQGRQPGPVGARRKGWGKP